MKRLPWVLLTAMTAMPDRKQQQQQLALPGHQQRVALKELTPCQQCSTCPTGTWLLVPGSIPYAVTGSFRSGTAVVSREKKPFLEVQIALIGNHVQHMWEFSFTCWKKIRLACVFLCMDAVASDPTVSLPSSLRLMESGGHGSTTAAFRSSSRHMKTATGQKLSAPRIIWQKLHSGHCLVPVKEALIPRT